MSDHKRPPSRVYIQWYGDGDPELDGPLIDPYEGVTWAENKVFDHDIKYIRTDVVKQRIADKVARAIAYERRRCRAETLREAYEVALGIGAERPAFAVDVAFKLRRMAEEAEQ